MITASVVLYKTKRDDINKLLGSILGQVDRLFIIDNSPNENIKYLFMEDEVFEYIPNDNIGYGASHNIALKRAINLNSKYHIILNPDIYFEPNIIKDIVSYMDFNKEVLSLMPKILYPDGKLQYLAKKLPSPFIMFARRFLPKIGIIKNLNDDFELRHSKYNKILNVPCLSGCFMFLRLSSVAKSELFFDERFFMYYEDFDLVRRCHRLGKTVFYPNVFLYHNHGKQAYKSVRMLIIFCISTLKYFNKYGWIFDEERNEINKQVDEDIKRVSDKC